MCPHEEKLTAWLLGDLPPEEQEAMARHLEACDSCRSAQEELARVLTPLRSGLEKDRRWPALPFETAFPGSREDPASAAEPPVRPRHWYWAWLFSPHEGLKRVAILALSFGTLFAMIGVVYQSLHPAPRSSGGVTYISYLQEKEAPAPALAPEPEMKSDAADQSRLSAAAALAESKTAPSEPAAIPEPPAPTRQAPALPTIADAEPAQEAVRKSFAAAPPQPAPAAAAPAAAATAVADAPAKAAKRARAKDEAAVRRPPAAPLAKPVQLAGAVAPTNAALTNAVITNAVSPKALNKP